MKLSVVIINYNVKNYLGQCLTSLERALADVESEVLVVDNHSTDGSVAYIEKHFPTVKLISSSHNLGFARANNLAIRRCQGEFILLLNPDTIIGEETIHRSIDFIESHPAAGAMGVRMLKADGSDAKESRRGMPTVMTSFYKMSGLCTAFPTSRRFGHYYMGYLPWNQAALIDIVSGAFCLLRQSALQQIGLLDEDFFMYGEDIELSCRLLKAGWQNWYLPVKILHYKGESTQKSSFRYVHVFYEAMLIFFRKHYRHTSFLLTGPIKVAIWLKALVALVGLLVVKTRRSMGFFERKKIECDYLFIGNEISIATCRRLADSKALNARFVVGSEQTLPAGHQGLTEPVRLTYVVYDIDAYRFDTIFEIFSKNHHPNVRLGTFNPQTRTIITAEDILQ